MHDENALVVAVVQRHDFQEAIRRQGQGRSATCTSCGYKFVSLSWCMLEYRLKKAKGAVVVVVLIVHVVSRVVLEEDCDVRGARLRNVR